MGRKIALKTDFVMPPVPGAVDLLFDKPVLKDEDLECHCWCHNVVEVAPTEEEKKKKKRKGPTIVIKDTPGHWDDKKKKFENARVGEDFKKNTHKGQCCSFCVKCRKKIVIRHFAMHTRTCHG